MYQKHDLTTHIAPVKRCYSSIN